MRIIKLNISWQEIFPSGKLKIPLNNLLIIISIYLKKLGHLSVEISRF